MNKMINKDQFDYNSNLRDKKLYVSISKKMRYSIWFLDAITEMLQKVSEGPYDGIYISYNYDTYDDKMSIAYIKIAILYLVQNGHKIFVNKQLRKLMDCVSVDSSAKFKSIDFEQCITDKNITYYQIDDGETVNQAVEILVDLIIDLNLNFDVVGLKGFLITTIGEVFSNAFNHSEQNKVYFMHDIDFKNGKFCLIINIVDYGKTIISNVTEFLHRKGIKNENIGSEECIRWAIKTGNTTRDGSGGYGLPTLIEYVKNVDGELLIFSGNAIYALKGDIENIFSSKGIFYGTSVSMKIPLFSRIIQIYEKNDCISINLDDIR